MLVVDSENENPLLIAVESYTPDMVQAVEVVVGANQ